ncbi:Uncharacterized protein YR821_2227 [Yersinia ruckeri]|uniref:Uncharacterized protein n=1 Tax=Yersinia ruckeri TaxID=29486 RepID=A0A0A8VJ71_YERRU|nr:hypothetical protein yruck0001_10460 [Yersinia ruckeri ATCC 29473]QTD77146.1 Uncharacterized protein YR821_2227 [Yersinia ruckeri]CEK28029.1 hypothetical protein CSF007_11415 [Yersinia ruckeri]
MIHMTKIEPEKSFFIHLSLLLAFKYNISSPLKEYISASDF